MEPIVSVLMTCYNREQFISSAIRSVLLQSFQDLELIISDDGSRDRSVEIAKCRDVTARMIGAENFAFGSCDLNEHAGEYSRSAS